MMYPFLQLDDGTEIVHSEMLPDGTVRVYLEKPDEKDCFHSASCILPQYRWTDVSGFTDAELGHYQQVVESVSHLIMEISQCGGFAQRKCHKGLDYTRRKMPALQ